MKCAFNRSILLNSKYKFHPNVEAVMDDFSKNFARPDHVECILGVLAYPYQDNEEVPQRQFLGVGINGVAQLSRNELTGICIATRQKRVNISHYVRKCE